MSGDVVLELRGVHTYYGKIHALQGIDIEVREGEIVTLIGSNGAGKTTTLKTISGLLHPRTGTVSFRGKDVSKTPPHELVRDGIAQAPEGRRIFSRLTVVENLQMGGYTRTSAEIAENVDHVFGLFPRLQERARQKGGTLSGGEQQMLAIGRALMTRPKVLLLDEPSLGLSPILIQQIFAIIRQINAEGTTILLVEQNALQALDVGEPRLRPADRARDPGRRRQGPRGEPGRPARLPRGDLTRRAAGRPTTMDEQRNEFRVEPVSSSGRQPGSADPDVPRRRLPGRGRSSSRGTWSSRPHPRRSPSGRCRRRSTSAGPHGGARRTPGPPAECAFAGGWRVFALGQPDRAWRRRLDGRGRRAATCRAPSRTSATRSGAGWRCDPLSARPGPDDQRIPFVTIVSDRIGGIGYCPPPGGSDGPPAGSRFEAWCSTAAGTPTPVPLQTRHPRTLRAPRSRGVHRQGPARRTQRRWAPGRYVFAVMPPDGGTYGRWFGVEIRTPPGRLSD